MRSSCRRWRCTCAAWRALGRPRDRRGNWAARSLRTPRHRAQHGQGQVGDHGELADLVLDGTKDLRDRLRIQVRPIGRNAPQTQVPGVQQAFKMGQERLHVRVGGLVSSTA